ncbi:hypothetical protein PG984_012919 [Apiospora sp. TS-2023a]
MSNDESRDYSRSESPEVVVREDGGRPIIIGNIVYKYRPTQTVYIRRPGEPQNEGPYKISAPSGPGQYTLLNLDNTPARGGEQVDENDLTESSAG